MGIGNTTHQYNIMDDPTAAIQTSVHYSLYSQAGYILFEFAIEEGVSAMFAMIILYYILPTQCIIIVAVHTTCNIIGIERKG